MKNKRLLLIVAIVSCLLLVPLIAMQFTDDVNWTLFDFLLAATLLFSSGLAIDLVLRKMNRTKYRITLIVFILAMLLLIWAEIGVGILGTPLSGN